MVVVVVVVVVECLLTHEFVDDLLGLNGRAAASFIIVPHPFHRKVNRQVVLKYISTPEGNYIIAASLFDVQL